METGISYEYSGKVCHCCVPPKIQRPSKDYTRPFGFLQDKIQAQDKLIEELEKDFEVYANMSNFKKIWDDDINPTTQDLFEIRGPHSIADFNVRAHEALAKIKEYREKNKS